MKSRVKKLSVDFPTLFELLRDGALHRVTNGVPADAKYVSSKLLPGFRVEVVVQSDSFPETELWQAPYIYPKIENVTEAHESH